MEEAWASSVFTVRSWFYSFSYGANNPLKG